MTYSHPVRRAPRRIRIRKLRVAGLLVALLALALGYQSLASSTAASLPSFPRLPATRPAAHTPRLGMAGGAVPDGTSVFDDTVPGVAKLRPDLLRALRQAANDSDLRFVVNSGWRSPAYENQLRREAVAKYGSEAEAARWVATGSTSPHVSGDAVDLGTAASSWLAAHGAAYGLCQIYANEPWHFELRTNGCPALYADPTHDPRMQK